MKDSVEKFEEKCDSILKEAKEEDKQIMNEFTENLKNDTTFNDAIASITKTLDKELEQSRKDIDEKANTIIGISILTLNPLGLIAGIVLKILNK